MHRRRNIFGIVVLALGMTSALQAGQVSFVAQAPCDTIVNSISPDARYAAVRTCTDVFLVDRQASTSVLVSHAAGSPTAAGNAASFLPAVSADGRYVAFRSGANNLVPGQSDALGADNVFLYDAATGTNTLISQRQSPGVPWDGFFFEAPSLSADGRYVAFNSIATDLVPGQIDSPGTYDLFLYDRVAGTLVLVSHASGSAVTAANDMSSRPVVSADGNYVLFMSEATNLVPGQIDTNGGYDIFLYDRTAGSTVLVSHVAGLPATAGSGSSSSGVLSADSRYIAFGSSAPDLVHFNAGGLNVFLYDRVTGTTILVSHQPGAPAYPGNGFSCRPSISADGRYIAFDSEAGNLAAGVSDTASSLDTYVYDRVTATATLVSHAANAPNVAAGSSYAPKISADGAFVAFSSYSSDHMLREEHNSGRPDLFLFDRVSGAIVLVTRSHELATREADDGFYADTGEWFIDDDGSHVVFTSSASDLVAGDTAMKGVFAFDNGLKGRFYTLTPCRLLDTRDPVDGPALGPEIELLSLHGHCGIPATAKALAVNATVIGPSSFGHLSLYPGDARPPATSFINFSAGQTRSNNAILPLASNADGTAAAWAAVTGGGTLHLTLDVMGYFE